MPFLTFLRLCSLVAVVLSAAPLNRLAAQPSSARLWNEAILDAIRADFARPTVHARNLFHLSVAQYDAWAAFDAQAAPLVLGRSLAGIPCPFSPDQAPSERGAAETAMSYAAYRLLLHRFERSPGGERTRGLIEETARATGVDPARTSTDYRRGAAELGNHIAHCLIEGGLRDGSNESHNYANRDYRPANPPLRIRLPGNPDVTDPNRWQPLALTTFIDQSGNPIDGATPDFLGAEWGAVLPFALSSSDRTVRHRDGQPYTLYHDPGPPPLIGSSTSHLYAWGFGQVARWSSHLDPSDGVSWDISPASSGNLGALPEAGEDASDFYPDDGSIPGSGHRINPHTGRPYVPQMVSRGDYTRVLAEFWADGPDSETPPGHWFTLLNGVNDRLTQRRMGGVGRELSEIEWEVKSYLALGGAMHDAAISAWGIKGWYDYIRPVSAIRAMAEYGQRSDATVPSFDQRGLPLEPGFAELIAPDDSLAGADGEHVGKVKLWAWRGTEIDSFDLRWLSSGVGWVRAEDWWPYQRPSFVTPPFAGYVSGHSTFSRAAAEVLTLLTGDAFFPGGMGEFSVPKDTFLAFESGPSRGMTLQWATYRDAADQCSLSRIWGGIHPPADDLPGRRIGEHVGIAAFERAAGLFEGARTASEAKLDAVRVHPNPVRSGEVVVVSSDARAPATLQIVDALGRVILTRSLRPAEVALLSTSGWASGLYVARLQTSQADHAEPFIVLTVD